jgi:hypothetical protein
MLWRHPAEIETAANVGSRRCRPPPDRRMRMFRAFARSPRLHASDFYPNYEGYMANDPVEVASQGLVYGR